MASSIVTADGKDLDSRYLGINATAKAASSAPWSGISGKPALLTPGVQLYTTQGGITIDVTCGKGGTATWTAPCNVILANCNGALYASTNPNGNAVIRFGPYTALSHSGSGTSGDSASVSTFPLKKGETVVCSFQYGSSRIYGYAQPINIG